MRCGSGLKLFVLERGLACVEGGRWGSMLLHLPFTEGRCASTRLTLLREPREGVPDAEMVVQRGGLGRDGIRCLGLEGPGGGVWREGVGSCDGGVADGKRDSGTLHKGSSETNCLGRYSAIANVERPPM